MKKINIALFLGIIIVLILGAASFYPEKLTKVDPYSTQTLLVDKSGEMHSVPFPPSVVGPLGTDELGRNIYSQIVYGTGKTMKIVVISVLAILLIAFPLGIAVGFGFKPGKWVLGVANITSSAIPALLICILIFNLPFVSSLSREPSLYAFALIIAAVGFGRMGTLIRSRVEFILSEPFIEGQVVIGKSRLQIALQNVIPHLLPDIMVYLSQEAGRTLFLLCQLGVFNIFVGNLKVADTLDTIGRNAVYEPEWGTMLGTAINLYKVYPWIVFPLVAAFFLGILGFNMLAEGLKIEFEKKNSHFITRIRKIPYFLSIRMLMRDIRQIPKRPLPGILKITVIMIIVLIVFFPRQFAYYPFDYKSAYRYIQELSSDKYEGRRSGTEGRDLAADFLAANLRKAGIKPGGSNGYENEFEIPDNRMIINQSVCLSFDGRNYTELSPGKDYRLVNFQPINCSGKAQIVSASEAHGIIRLVNFQPAGCSGKSQMTSASETNGIITNKAVKSVCVFIPENIKQFLYESIIENLERNYAAILTFHEGNFHGISAVSDPLFNKTTIPVIELADEWKDKLENNSKLYARIKISVAHSKFSTGKNIIGIIPGTDSKLKDEFVIVGASYDGIGWQGNTKYPCTLEGASSASISLEAAKAIMLKGPPKRTVVFMFWDYSGRNECGAFKAGRFNGFNDKEGDLYIDLKYLGASKHVVFDSSRNSISMPEAQRFARILENEYKRLGIKLDLGTAESQEADAMQQRDMGSVVMQSYGSDKIVRTAEDNPEQASMEGIKYIGQALVNALIKMIY